MKRTHPVFSSELNLRIPKDWSELSAKSFKYLCKLLVSEFPANFVDTLFLLAVSQLEFVGLTETGADGPLAILGRRRKSHRKEFFLVRPIGLGFAELELKWIHDVPQLQSLAKLMPKVHKSARELRVKDMTFAEFLAADSYYNGYVTTQKTELADKLVVSLWPKAKAPAKKSKNIWMRAAAVIWFSAIKKYLTNTYSDLFAPPDKDQIFAGTYDMRQYVNTQIRALTKGDITAEEKVLNVPVHRALYELNELARECKELKEIHKT